MRNFIIVWGVALALSLKNVGDRGKRFLSEYDNFFRVLAALCFNIGLMEQYILRAGFLLKGVLEETM